MAMQANRIEHGCPKDRGELIYDVADQAYHCRTCDYSRHGLNAPPGDLVVVAGRVSSNGTHPAGEAYRSSMISISDLAKEMRMAPSTIVARADTLGIPVGQIPAHGYGRSSLRAVTTEEAERIRSYAPITAPKKYRGGVAQPASSALAVPLPETVHPGPSPARPGAPVALHRESQTVFLQSGGTVELSIDVSLFSLAPADRAFLFDLIDRVAAYPKE